MRLQTSKTRLTPSRQALEARIASLEAELAHHRRLAALGTLASGIGHEINNILTPVAGYAELARRTPSDAGLVEHSLDRIVAGVERASKVAEAILAMAAPGDTRSRQLVTDVKATIEDALASLGRGSGPDGLRLETELEAGLQAAIDPVSLHQVVLNLAINAERAMGGSGVLTIRTRRESRSTGNIPIDTATIAIEVQDSGCGITSAVLPRIFDPFSSFDLPVSPPDERNNGVRRRAHGLGLAICRQLIEHAGGEISVRSTVGEGTCFSVRLPEARQVLSAAA